MLIISMSGFKEEDIELIRSRSDDIAALVKTKEENILFIKTQNKIYSNTEGSDAYISVDWIGRPLMQEKMAKLLTSIYEDTYLKVWIRFNELNTFLYLNGENKS